MCVCTLPCLCGCFIVVKVNDPRQSDDEDSYGDVGDAHGAGGNQDDANDTIAVTKLNQHANMT